MIFLLLGVFRLKCKSGPGAAEKTSYQSRQRMVFFASIVFIFTKGLVSDVQYDEYHVI